MNKFRNQDCGDYKQVAKEISRILKEIREGKTPLQEADELIRQHYLKSDACRLNIIRISGAKLPMDQCYINLAIVNVGTSGSNPTFSFLDILTWMQNAPDVYSAPPPSYSFFARQKVETPENAIQVKLSDIFDRRDGSLGTVSPRRIFIQGRAGVGKTTLCKKIVYEFTQGNWPQWKRLFDRILWVPLRTLKPDDIQKGGVYTLEGLFQGECFCLHQNLADALAREVRGQGSRTLFLLDGLDEVSHVLEGDREQSHFLRDLLRQPNVIITSRPSVNATSTVANIDLELEAIGFYPQQVQDYIAMTFPNPDSAVIDSTTANDIQVFIQEHRLIQGLARIPIQLDALCYSWQGLGAGDRLDTMTDMYKAIELRLWKKDMVQLGKIHGTEESIMDTLKSATRQQIERHVSQEIEFLEALAFTGLHNNLTTFQQKHLDDVNDTFTPTLLRWRLLKSTSFLRTSDPSFDESHHHYDFIHLTFQEYFAARYFVRKWKTQDPQLQVLKFRDEASRITSAEDISVALFLRTRKYTGHFNIFWRFVAGLLDSENERSQVWSFIKMIEEEPLDLLGPVHQRLVMHCLAEVTGGLPGQAALTTEDNKIQRTRGRLERKLFEWMRFEYPFTGCMRLADEPEMPESALQSVFLEVTGDDERAVWLNTSISTQKRPCILRIAADKIAAFAENPIVAWDAYKALNKASILPDEILQTVISWIADDDQDELVKGFAAEVLQKGEGMPQRSLQMLAAELKNMPQDIQTAIYKILSKSGHSRIPERLQEIVVSWLTSKDDSLREAAVRVLWGLNLEKATQEAVTVLLNDSNPALRQAAIHTLGSQPWLPDAVLQKIAFNLSHEAEAVQSAATSTLMHRSDLSDNSLLAVGAQLEGEPASVRIAAIEILCLQLSLPGESQRALAARLTDKEADVRIAAIKNLSQRSDLIGEVLQAMEARFDDDYAPVRIAAIDTLITFRPFATTIVQRLAERLRDEEADVRIAAIRSSSQRSDLTDDVRRLIEAQLGDGKPSVRIAAIGSLSQRSDLKEDVWKVIEAQLGDGNPSVRIAAMNALGERPVLTKEVLGMIIKRLEDQEADVRKAAITILNKQDSLQEENLELIAASFENQDQEVRLHALRCWANRGSLPERLLQVAFDSQWDRQEDIWDAANDVVHKNFRTLPDTMCKAVVAMSTSEHAEYRERAVYALNGRGEYTIPDNVVDAVAERLKDEQVQVRWAAYLTLGSITNPSKPLVQRVADRLADEIDYSDTVMILKGLGLRNDLEENIVQAIAAKLTDIEIPIRVAAVETLGFQRNLGDKILRDLANMLHDETARVRTATIAALYNQQRLYRFRSLPQQLLERRGVSAVSGLARPANLSDDILLALADRLEDEERSIQLNAEQLLRQHDSVYHSLLSGPKAASLYRILLHRSFNEQVSLYIDDGYLCINSSERISRSRVDGCKSDLLAIMKEARPENYPSEEEDEEQDESSHGSQ